MTNVRTGRCLCGAVRFSTMGDLRGVVFCHCSQCRKQTGHYYAATNVGNDRITIDGPENLTWYAASTSAKRGFCRICGAALFWKREEGDDVSVMAGAFDQSSGLEAECHIFVADKGDYYSIDDGLPRFDRSSVPVKIDDD